MQIKKFNRINKNYKIFKKFKLNYQIKIKSVQDTDPCVIIIKNN